MATTSSTKKILTIDDEQSIVDLIVDILENNNYTAISATKWTEAVDALNHENPDLILLDLKMPTVDGTSILDFIVSEGFNVPVVVVSGFVTHQVSEELRAQGVRGIVKKPFKSRLLLEEIEKNLPRDETAPETDNTLDTLYSRPATSPPEANSGETISAVDALYGKTEPQARNDQAPSKPPTNDILQALQKNGVPEKQELPPKNESKNKEISVPPELLEVLQKKTESKSLEQAQKSKGPPPLDKPIDNPITSSPTGSAPPYPAFEKRESRGYRPPRPRANKGNMMFMGAITVVCLLVAGFLAVMQWVASEAPVAMEEFKSKAEDWGQQQVNDQMKQMKQQMQQQQVKQQIQQAK